MSLPHALLGLLAVAPRTGYELTKAFAGDLGRYAWQAGHTSIYPELARLADNGLIEVTHEGARGSRTYAVTDAGRDELRTLAVHAARGRARCATSWSCGCSCSPRSSPPTPASCWAGSRRAPRRRRPSCGGLRAEAGPVRLGPEGFGQLAAEYGLRQYDAVHDWAVWAIDQLDQADQAVTASTSAPSTT